MDCAKAEGRLSEYMEKALPVDEMADVAGHLHECGKCASLLEEMRAVVAACKSFPKLDPDVALLDRVLMRTIGRPRSRSLLESLREYIFVPMLTPRFAAGAGLVVLFLVFSMNLLAPRAASMASALSPREMLRHLDRGVQHLYGEGLRWYDKKNELQAEFQFIRNSVLNKLGIMIEQLDVPLEGKQKPGEEGQQQQSPRGQKSSVLLLPA